MGAPELPQEDERQPHLPVLLAEVVEALDPVADRLVVDGTFGAGGYSRALLARGAQVIAIDRDPNVIRHAEELAADYPDRFMFRQANFSDLEEVASDAGQGRGVDAVVLDIGVSSMQLDQAERGFSFMRDGPLDMRMGLEGPTAADLVNTLNAEEIADILYAYGEERRSRRIAQFIIAARAEAPIVTTLELARIIEKAIGRKPGDMHPATRSFQALRIAVNAELDQLVEALVAAERLLGEGGTLAVVTFHSLEDRIVKRFLSPDKAEPNRSRHLPQVDREQARWIEVAKPRRAASEEVKVNPRARSAILRAARRSGATARSLPIKGLGLPQIGRGAA